MNCDIVSEHFGIAMSENEATEFLKKVESYKQDELFGKSEQLEQLAEENTKQIVCSWYDYCKDCMNENYRRIKNMCHPAKWATQAYIDGYREAGKNEIHILESMEIKRLVKENEELKGKLYSCEKNVFAELNNETAQSNAMLLDEVAELKAQIEKMKCCENCKHHNVACMLEDPCENEWNKWEMH